MSPVEIYLSELALSLGEQQQYAAKRAKESLPRARERLKDIQFKRGTILAAVERAAPHSHLHEIARQIDKDLAFAMAEVSSLELEKDAAEAALTRAAHYVPLTDKGVFACPRCWIEENLSTGVEPQFKASVLEIYKCPSCSYRFSIDYEYHPEGVLPRSQNQAM